MSAYTALWLREVLLPQEPRVAAGLAYHLCDLLLPELAVVCGGEAAGPAPQQPTLLALVEPYCQALARTGDKALVYRLRWAAVPPIRRQCAAALPSCFPLPFPHSTMATVVGPARHWDRIAPLAPARPPARERPGKKQRPPMNR